VLALKDKGIQANQASHLLRAESLAPGYPITLHTRTSATLMAPAGRWKCLGYDKHGAPCKSIKTLLTLSPSPPWLIKHHIFL
jgi:hypothetical protein